MELRSGLRMQLPRDAPLEASSSGEHGEEDQTPPGSSSQGIAPVPFRAPSAFAQGAITLPEHEDEPELIPLPIDDPLRIQASGDALYAMGVQLEHEARGGRRDLARDASSYLQCAAEKGHTGTVAYLRRRARRMFDYGSPRQKERGLGLFWWLEELAARGGGGSGEEQCYICLSPANATSPLISPCCMPVHTVCLRLWLRALRKQSHQRWSAEEQQRRERRQQSRAWMWAPRCSICMARFEPPPPKRARAGRGGGHI